MKQIIFVRKYFFNVRFSFWFVFYFIKNFCYFVYISIFSATISILFCSSSTSKKIWIVNFCLLFNLSSNLKSWLNILHFYIPNFSCNIRSQVYNMGLISSIFVKIIFLTYFHFLFHFHFYFSFVVGRNCRGNARVYFGANFLQCIKFNHTRTFLERYSF